MGLFDIFKKKAVSPPPRQNSLPQFCYDMASSFLPPLVFADTARMIGYFDTNGKASGASLYTLACHSQNRIPVPEHADQFQSHTGKLSDGSDYYILQYPIPPPVDPDLMKAVLAPHFSAILHSSTTGETYYYILGQGPRGGTTMRKVISDGTKWNNWNLGPGPVPELSAFVQALEKTKSPPTLAQITIEESDSDEE